MPTSLPDDAPCTLGDFGTFVAFTGELPGSRDPRLAGAAAVVVVDGLMTLDVVIGAMRAAQLLGPGDVVGLDGDHLPEHEEVLLALAPTRLCVFREGLDELIARRPAVGAKLMRASVERHRRQAVHRAIVQLPALEDRVLGVCWMLADRFGRVTPEGVRLDLPLTHLLLGRLAGASRSSVTSAVTALEAEGHMHRGADRQIVLDRRSRARAGQRAGAPAGAGGERRAD